LVVGQRVERACCVRLLLMIACRIAAAAAV
jgi:hypothetical protein